MTGMKMIVADYSQIELRTLAHFTQDKNLMAAYPWEGEALDLHSLTARRAYRLQDDAPVPVDKRALAKNVNFSMAYGATAFTLMNRYEVKTEEEANALINGFYKAYPKVKPWQEKVIRDCRARYRKKGPGQPYVAPYVTTILGRKRRLPEIMWPSQGETGKARRAAERQAINTVIQGSAADIVKMAMVALYRVLPPEMRIILSVHDEVVVLTPEARAEECAELVRDSMEGIDILRVPLKADVHICDRWSEAK